MFFPLSFVGAQERDPIHLTSVLLAGTAFFFPRKYKGLGYLKVISKMS